MKTLFPAVILCIGLFATGLVTHAQAQPVPGYHRHGPPPRHRHHRHYHRPPPPPYRGRELPPR